MKHTPGPWKLDFPDDGDIVLETGHNVIALDDMENACGQCLADYRLIAAAPDLLSALQQIASNGDIGLRKHDEAKTLQECVAYARMAIAKATESAS